MAHVQGYQGRKAILLSCSLFIILFCLVPFHKPSLLPDSYVGKDVSAVLQAMPRKDREELEFFFRELIREDCFGYVLLGEKPMALSTWVKRVNLFACLWEEKNAAEADEFKPKWHERFLWNFQAAISSHRIRFNRAYEVWKKYEKFFPTSRFVLCYENQGESEFSIVLINKRAFVQKVEEHIDDFKAILNNREANGETLLAEARRKPFLSEILMNHDALIGTVLGYGRDHAFWFYQKYRLTSEKERELFCEKFHLTPGWRNKELGFSWSGEEYASLNSQKTSLTNLEFIQLPGFRAETGSAETKRLRNHYLETREAILHYYEGKDFLEATLRLLTS